ncbi:hypothetical protein MMC09_005193 [Bachmanniomyces sp. S44760]|nr:hypothetical protein [Bachmanniomyces sp. S44760]
MPLVGGRRYFTSTAVFLNEVLKLAVCLTVALYDISRNLPSSMTATSLFSHVIGSVFTGDSWKLAIPAGLYTLQNSLQYVAISNLDSATFQVTSQFKILPTALFTVLVLGRSLSGRKWGALALLMLGLIIVQLPNANTANMAPLKDAHSRLYFPRSFDEMKQIGSAAAGAAARMAKRSATYEGIDEDFLLEHPVMNPMLGLTAALAGCTLSALASVYFEKILKEANSSSSLWIRNIQLSFYSLFPALFIGVIFVDGEEISKNGFFIGYNWVVWTTILFQAVGGIAVALAVAYADNIAKSFATSISILISLSASIVFFDFTVTSNVCHPLLVPCSAG